MISKTKNSALVIDELTIRPKYTMERLSADDSGASSPLRLFDEEAKTTEDGEFDNFVPDLASIDEREEDHTASDICDGEDSSDSPTDKYICDAKEEAMSKIPTSPSNMTSEWSTDMAEEVDSSTSMPKGFQPINKKKRSSLIPMPQFVRRRPQIQNVGYGGESLPPTPKETKEEKTKFFLHVPNPAEEPKKRRKSSEYPRGGHRGSIVVDGVVVPDIPQAPGRNRIHVPDPPTTSRKKKKRKSAKASKKDKKFPMRAKLNAYREKTGLFRFRRRSQTRTQTRSRRNSRMTESSYDGSIGSERSSEHKPGPIEIGRVHGWKPLNVDYEKLSYAHDEFRHESGSYRKKSAAQGPIQIGRNKDFKLPNYNLPHTYGFDDYIPAYGYIYPDRKKSHALGPTDIGRADYDEDSYELEISEEDFLKERCFASKETLFNIKHGIRAKKKRGPVEIGRVPKSIWKPYTGVCHE